MDSSYTSYTVATSMTAQTKVALAYDNDRLTTLEANFSDDGLTFPCNAFFTMMRV